MPEWPSRYDFNESSINFNSSQKIIGILKNTTSLAFVNIYPQSDLLKIKTEPSCIGYSLVGLIW